ncbi:MAG: thioredoxin family protein [Chitinophagaceae bacterium]|nr:thioredoxin family protein [Chitinophagaceae bacterium]
MKNTGFILMLLLIAVCGNSQNAAKKSISEIPAFKIMQTNGAYLQNKDLPRNKPVVIIYFSPNCDHCILLMDQLFPRLNEFKKASVLFVTFVDPRELIPFEKKYNTLAQPNIFVGSEGLAYTVKNFYRLEKTPFTAVYNKQGKLLASYKKDTPVNDVIDILKRL